MLFRSANTYYAKGGDGGRNDFPPAQAGANADINTGSAGGGGGQGGGGTAAGGNGGSGIIVIKYNFTPVNAVFMFANTGAFVVPDGITTIDYLIVGGGGGGGSMFGLGSRGAGGGGAGGILSGTGYPVGPNQMYVVSIGAGGAAGPQTNGNAGANGGNTFISTSNNYTANASVTSNSALFIALGGGGGGGMDAVAGKNGGSGGGAGNWSTTVGVGTPGQGYNGGSSGGSQPTGGSGGGGGGGGGAGGAGWGPGFYGGNAGIGIFSSITGSNTYYGKGGDGGGGGQPGSATNIAGNTANISTGSGGGGASGTASPVSGSVNSGAAGSSGIAIIKISPVQTKVAAFSNTSTWTVPNGVTSVQYLVVAGGGGGGGGNPVTVASGGGGAGGVKTGSSFSVTPGQIYTIVIGSGGAASTNGSNSGIWNTSSSLWSNGGGSGGLYGNPTGTNGNSGEIGRAHV